MGNTFKLGKLVNGLNVLDNGNVGIGVASPSTTLHLSTTNGIRLQYPGNTGFIQFSTNASNDYIFSGYDGERIKITSAGNLQIDSGQLNTPKSLYFQANSSAGGNLGSIDWYNLQWDGFVRAQIKAETDTGLSNGRLVFSTGAGGVSERMRITSVGRVGIGTTSPGFTLDVSTSNNNSVFAATTTFTHTGGYLDHSTFLAPNMTGGALSVSFGKSASNYNTGKIVFNYAGNNSTSNSVGVGFYNADNILVVRGDGNVGIGTTVPGAKLDISGGQYNTGLIVRTSSDNGAGLNLKNTDPNGTGGHDWYIISTGSGNGGGPGNLGFYDGTSGNYMVYFKGNGYVGIGTTSPGFRLDVSHNTHEAFRVINSGSANGNNATAQFLNTHGNHSWGICAEFRVGSSGGSDRASILFSHAYDSNTWGIGFGYNDSSYFRINRDQGPYGGGWGATLFSLDRSGNYSFSGSNVSDRRNKKDIVYVVDSQMDTILKLRPATFVKKSPGKDEYSEHTHTGFIAQDILEENIPNLVHGSEEKGYGLDYDGILALAVKAIQELKAEIEILKNK
jgi:hypothetical protein